MEYEKCPNCGNRQIVLVAEELIERRYSVLTGKLLKSDKISSGTNCWNYICRCGWNSELYTE